MTPSPALHEVQGVERRGILPCMSERSDLEAFDAIAGLASGLRQRLGRTVIGQANVIDRLIAAVFVQGHVLVVGVPGLAKTMLVRSLADALGWRFRRIQFTPDMMPSDVVGTELIHVDPTTGDRSMRFTPGPIFANLVLADEINRTPPRTQAALLEAMAERQVTAAGQTMALDPPFVVVATQNPIEQEGTYPLPEAQLDRFMFSLNIEYPEAAEEKDIVAERLPEMWRRESAEPSDAQPLADAAEMVRASSLIGRMPVAEHVVDYIVRLVRASRPDADEAPDTVKQYVSWGVGPRAGQYLALGARAVAAMAGEPTPNCQHVRDIAPAVLAHRIIPNYTATGEGVEARQIVDELLKVVPERA